MDRYVYYQVPVEQADDFRARMLALHAQLQAQTGVRCVLQRRPEPTRGLHTWMEIYADLPADFDALLQPQLALHGLHAFIVGPRHVDDFLAPEKA